MLILAFAFVTPMANAYAADKPSVTAVTTAEEIAVETLAILAAYSPSSVRILESEFERRQGTEISTVVKTTGGSITAWATERKSEATHTRRINETKDLIHIWSADAMGLLSVLSFAVHENYHGFQDAGGSILGSVVRRKHLLDDGELVLSFSSENILKTELATAGIQSDLKTHRWNTYVSKGASTVANQWGAYGLLEELSAYYYGAKSVFDVTPYMLEFLQKHGIRVSEKNYSFEMVCNYLHNYQENMLAFYEFKFWTLEYLLHLRENYPDHYQSVMSNKEFVIAFDYFVTLFEELTKEQFPSAMAKLSEELASLGVSFRETNSTYWFGQSGRRELGLGRLMQDIERLRNRLETSRYADLLKTTHELAVQTLEDMPELTIILVIGSPMITINGMPEPINNQGTAPVIVNNSTLVPLRAIFEALGLEVEWNNGEIIGIKEDTEIRMSIGDSTAYKNGAAIALDTPPQLMNSSTMVPLRFIAESIGANVEWIPVTRTIVITG